MAWLAASPSPALRDMLAFSCLLNCTVTIESSLSWLGCRVFRLSGGCYLGQRVDDAVSGIAAARFCQVSEQFHGEAHPGPAPQPVPDGELHECGRSADEVQEGAAKRVISAVGGCEGRRVGLEHIFRRRGAG